MKRTNREHAEFNEPVEDGVVEGYRPVLKTACAALLLLLPL